MCYECWQDEGSPRIVNEKTIKCAELISDLYNHDGCGTGGYAHVVTDDWNLDDQTIDYCLNYTNVGEYEYIPKESAGICIDVLNSLKNLTIEERFSAMAIFRGFIKCRIGTF